MDTNLVPVNEVKSRVYDALSKYDVADRHSFYQLQCFVIGKEQTHQGKLRQCILELKSRRKNLTALELELEDQKDNLELVQYEIDSLRNPLPHSAMDDKVRQIQLRKTERKYIAIENTIVELQDKIQYVAQEAMFLIELFNKLYKEEPLRNWDEPEVQKEYWAEKLKNELNIRILLRHPLDPELLKTIMALHDEAPVKRRTIELLQLKPAETQSLPDKSI